MKLFTVGLPVKRPFRQHLHHKENLLVTFRPSRTTDSQGLAEVQVNSYRTAYAGIFPPSYLEAFSYEEQAADWQAWFIERPDDILLVATNQDDQVVGYLLARLEADIYPGYDAEIIALHVSQPWQGQGIGRTLLNEGVAALQKRGCDAFMLWTLAKNPTRQWYERLQGQLLGEKRFQVNGWEIVEVAYGWQGD